jgi:DNA repair exonuclease SbcCD ATPase subunit
MFYCLFGTSVLDFSLEHYINNEGAKSLKTTVEFEAVDGKTYTCVRGNTGAELRRGDEVICTNHAPVTAKVEELLGVPAGRADSTIFAKQGKVQGVLALGPTALSAYIEELAGFQEVDALVSTLNSKLETGSVKSYESMIEQKESQLAALPPVVDISGLQVRLESEQVNLSALGVRAHTLQAEIAAQEKANQTVEARRQEINRQIQETARALETRKRLEAEVASAVGLPEKIAALELQMEQARAWMTYQGFTSLPAYAGDEWEGDVRDLAHEVADVQARLTTLNSQRATAAADIRNKEKERLTSTVCPITREVCGQLSDPALIERTNAEVGEALAALAVADAGFAAAATEAQGELRILQAIQQYQTGWERTLLPFTSLVSVDENVVPWKATWATAVPVNAGIPAEDPQHLQTKVAAAERAQAQLDVLPVVATTAAVALAQELEQCQTINLEAARKEQQEVMTAEFTLRRQVDEIAEQIKVAEQNNFHREQTLKLLTGEITALQESIKTVQENNDLLKAVRAARLVVAELLWSKVLGATSRYFSLMRGEESIIKRSPKGFLINLHPVVSGSTFDLLGLALRITLAKLFSQCGILVLDEAGAGMDLDRSALMLGVLAAAGFEQVLHITHRDTDEAAGEHLLVI